MVELRLHGSSVDTVFDLLGRNENDMTFALGWGLSRNDAILRRFVERVATGAALEPPVVVELQKCPDPPTFLPEWSDEGRNGHLGWLVGIRAEHSSAIRAHG